ncbi:MAG: glycosyltransferase family 4 protein [Candidatus Saccharimonadales bacterium]
MRVVWFSWKDRSHPQAGGAETVSGELMDRLVRDGHEIVHITAKYQGTTERSTIKGVKIIRVGNRYSVYLQARKLFLNELAEWPDYVIDEMNTIPFVSGSYSKKKNVLLSYQLARKVWFYQMPLPLSVIGYLIEPMYLRWISKYYPLVLTESESTKKDMQRHGFKKSNINIFRVGTHLLPIQQLEHKEHPSVILSLGALRPMKRTMHAVKAFEVARESNPTLTLVIAGDTNGAYAKKVLEYIRKSPHSKAIHVRGRVSDDERLHLMRSAGMILVTSVKEGWGLIVTEANTQGTPAIVYDVDGLRDSVKHRSTGLICRDGNYAEMGNMINDLVGNNKLYQDLRSNAWSWSKEFTFENSYNDFSKHMLDASTGSI